MFSDRRQELLELVYAGRLSAEEAAAQYRALAAEPAAPQAAAPPDAEVRPNDVAVVGIAGRFPGADDPDEYWELLVNNRSAIVDVEARWPEIDQHYSSDLTDLTKAHSRWGGLMRQIDDFDPLFFELSPRQAQLMEPRQRLLLMESWKALEDAGLSRLELDGQRCGIFVGCEGSSEYFDQMRPDRMDGNAVLGHSNAVLSARLAYFMNLRGPSMTIDTACSSSLVAIHLACQAIRDGSADVALAGGVTVMLSLGQQLLQSRMGMLSPEGKCKTFDVSADGFVPAECAAMVVLKPLAAAIRDKSHIYGVIKGSAINQDGKTNGITAPSSAAQQELIEAAVAMSGVSPAEVRYVEAHGTGTRLGDPIEVDALARTYGAPGAGRPTGIGSVKTNIGHASAASGVASLVKLLLAMQHDLIPASLNCTELNPRIDLGDGSLYVVRANEPLFANQRDEVVTAVSSFGYSGTNAHLVVSSARALNQTEPAQRPASGRLPFFASAASPQSLRLLCADYRHWLTATDNSVDPTQLALQSLALRTPLKYRVVLDFQDPAELADRLGALTDQDIVTTRANSARAEVAATNERIDWALSRANVEPEQIVSLLNQLADGFRRGIDGDYHRLARLTDHRLPLPTYRFATSSFGLDPEDLAVADPAVGAQARTPSPAPAPTSGFELRPLADGGLECVLSGDEAFLRDHSGVLPGVMYLELFRAAAAAHAPERRVRALRNVSWLRLMHVPPGSGARLVVSVQDRGPQRVDMTVQVAGQPPFATAQAEYGPAGPAPRPSAEPDPWRGLDGGQTAVEDYRALLAANGVGVGPTFRGVQRIHTDEAHLVGELGLTEPVPGIDALAIHPSHVDGGFSAIAAWICDQHPDQQGLYVPYSLGRLEMFDLSQPLHSVRVHRTQEASGTQVATAGYELNYLSQAGEVVLRIEGMYLRRVQPGADSTPTAGHVVALTEVWQDAEAVEQPVEPLVVGIARSAGELEQFRRALADRTTPGVLAAHGVAEADLRPGEFCLAGLDEAALREFFDARIPADTALRFLLLGAPASDESTDRIESGVLTVFRLVRTLLRRPVNSPVDIVLLSFGDAREQAVSGFLRTMNLEKPLYRGRVVSLDATADPVAVLRLEAGQQTDGYDVRHQQGSRQQLELQQLPAADFAADDASYIPGGSFLITGGAGGIGLGLAGHLLGNGAARVYLCGRSALSETRQTEVAALRGQGHDLTYLRCDVTDRESVAGLVERLRGDAAEGPVLDGVFHAAGVLRDRFIIAKDAESFGEVIGPKTVGTDLLVAAAHDLGAGFVCFFSSTSSVLGNPGQCDYSFGNRYLDVLAQRGQAEQPRLISINWSVWDGGGMQIPEAQLAALADRYGLTPLPLATGFAAMDASISSGRARTVLLHGEREKILGNFFVPSQPDDAGQPATAGDDVTQALTEDLREVICATLRLAPDEIDFDDNLARYGFDSISFSELANRLNDKFELDITPAIFFGYTYLHELRQGLIDQYGDRLSRHYAARVSVGADDVELPAAMARPQTVASPPPEPAVARPAGYAPVAIIGMSTRLPMSGSSEEFWEHLRAGDDLVSEIPGDRWDWRAIHGDTRVDRHRTPFHHGAFMTAIDSFDPYFFGIAGTDAELMDPQERLMLEEAWHALEDAGYDPTSLAGSDTGVFVGVSTGDYKELLIKQSFPSMLTQTMVPNRIAYALNLHGPSLVVDTACSSAAVAIHQAVEQIQSGRCRLALAGGVNVICAPGMYVTQGRMNMLSPDGSCKTFDSSANGYVRGEGCGMVVLKALDAALADSDRILGIIRGSAVNHGGTASNLFAPNEVAQSEVVRAALTSAQVPASSVSYIETHGTGTALGDPIEVNGLKRAYRSLYRDEQLDFDEHDPPVYLGAVKTNTGHLEAASALPGLLKILYSFQHGVIPRNIHFNQVNPQLQIERTPFELATSELHWDQLAAQRPDGVRMAGLSSFGIGGVNAHLVLQAPAPAASAATASGPFCLPVSARTRDQLLDYVASLRDFVAAHSQPVPGDFLARCAAALGFAEVDDLDLTIPLEDYGADLAALATALDADLSTAGVDRLEPRLSLAELARRVPAETGGPVESDAGFLAALCHVFQTGRTRFGHRAAFVFADATDLLAQFNDLLADPESHEFFGVADKRAAASWVADALIDELARLWVGGVEVDFTARPGHVTPTRISAPGYPFDRQRFWFTDYDLDDVGAQPEVAPPAGAAASPAPEQPAPGGDVTATIKAVLSRLLKVPLDQIEPDAEFSDYGLDSIRLIQFGAELNETFGLDADPSLILDHPTLATLAPAIGALMVSSTDRTPRPQPGSGTDSTSESNTRPDVADTEPRLNYPVQLSAPSVLLVSAAKQFEREPVVSFWRDLKAGNNPEIELSAAGPEVLGALRAAGYRYFHHVVRNAAGQHAEVYIAGEGSPLLMIMGVGMAPSFAAHQIEALAGKRQIICISMPGVGLSPVVEDLSLSGLASFVLGTLDELGIARFDILGVSWGSLLAVTLAWQQPERVTNLVLMSPNADMGVVEDPGKYVTGIDEAMARDFAVVDGGDQAERFYQATECLETRAFLHWSKYFGTQTVSRHQTLSILHEVTQRSLVIIGARDTIIEPREAEVVALYLRNAATYVIDDASHLPLVTHPQLINELVDSFLDGHDVAGVTGPATA